MYVITGSQLHKGGLDEIYKIVRAEYHSVYVDYLFLQERRRKVSKKIKKFEKHRLGNFYGTVGFVILAVISTMYPSGTPTKFAASHATYSLFELILGPI
jgi:hypothetical protein